MNRQTTGARKLTAWLSFLLTVLAALTLDVRAQLNVANLRQLDRGLLWTGFRNQGTQGKVLAQYSSRTANGLTYPGMGSGMMLNADGPDYREYWGLKPGFGYRETKDEGQNTSGGESVWVLARTGDQYMVSYSGLFLPTDDIVPMYYDIADSPEKDYGYKLLVPRLGTGAGLEISNYYPGRALQTDPPNSGKPYEVLNHRFDSYMDADKDHVPEDIVFCKWTTESGITVTRKAMAWSYQGFDDFFILELVFKNTGDSDGDGLPDLNGGAGYQLNDTYFAFANMFVVSQAGLCWRFAGEGLPGDRGGENPNDDIYRYTDAANYDGPAAYTGLKLSYQRDGDNPLTFDEDTGDPIISDINRAPAHPGGFLEGQLMSYQYIGMAPLAYRDAGASHTFNAADQDRYVNPTGEQPYTSRWWEMENIQRTQTDFPNVTNSSDRQMYEALTGPVSDNPATTVSCINVQTYGPYDLAVGDSAKIVIAYVAASGANAVARPNLPAYSVDIETFAVDGIPLSESQRISRLAKGEEALVDHLKAAQFAYDNGYDLPDYPPDVEFYVLPNENAQNQLIWSDAAESSPNPDYTGIEALDIAGYRVYRSTWQEFGPWTLVATIPKGTSGGAWTYSGNTYSWRDEDSAPGFNYFYNVRAYASPHADWTNGISTMADLPDEVQGHLAAGLEGGYASPLQRSNQVSSPFMPQTEAGDLMQKQIRVVPNPFSLASTEGNYQNQLKIRFVGIPQKCRIGIYSFAGDLIAQVMHDDPASGEENWQQRTEHLSAPEVATGVYFYVVESLMPASMGRKATGTFVVIR